MARSHVELLGLEYEAERLVRSGTSRAEVSRLLGVHPQTLAGWALKGGWRKKDLDLERSAAITRRVVGNVARAHAWENEKQAAGREQLRLMQAAFAMIASGDAGGVVALMAEMKERQLKALPGLDTTDEYAAEAAQMRAEGVRGIAEAGPIARGRVLNEDEVGDDEGD